MDNIVTGKESTFKQSKFKNTFIKGLKEGFLQLLDNEKYQKEEVLDLVSKLDQIKRISGAKDV